ncbi:MAG TPA: FecR domain-containing protein [Pyrinomonadaceae bacterium]|nr:FecR domain-containing protein [Pyrinomonadaceae bacterium]
MFSQHVSQELSAYCQGELAEQESRQVAEHLVGCQRCRRELEEIKLGISLAEQLPRASAPANMWNEIEAALREQSRSALSDVKPSSGRRFVFDWRLVAAACVVMLLAFSAAWFFTRQPNSKTQLAGNNKQTEVRAPTQTPVAPAWDVARLAGAPQVGVERIEGSGRLFVGEWLETDSSSRARINVANIGQVEIEPNSRVRLVQTSATEHRLAMERGLMRANIDAPPRLFIVDTPSAVAVDLGCAYTLEVDDAGRGHLHVTAGWVALEAKGRESLVPAGAACITEPGKGPGTPYFDDVSAKFRDALERLDFAGGGAQALKIVLAEAREYDTLTLWHLLSRVEGAERRRVYERMAALIPPPAGVTREGIMQLDKGMLNLWKTELEWAWFE